VKTVRLALLFAATFAACTRSPSVPEPSPPTTVEGHGAVVRLEIVPIPEGPPAPVFERDAAPAHQWVRPLSDASEYIPSPLPEPLEQPADCGFGGDLVVTFEDGAELRYGPCRRPPAIDQLWAGMVYVIDNGECVPRCGPGGAFGPFEAVIHVPSPDDIGQPDWANPIFMSAWESACSSDREQDGFQWSGHGFHVSDAGMIVAAMCDDGSRHTAKVIFDPVAGGPARAPIPDRSL